MVTAVGRHGAGRSVVHVGLCVVVLCSAVVVIRSEEVIGLVIARLDSEPMRTRICVT